MRVERPRRLRAVGAMLLLAASAGLTHCSGDRERPSPVQEAPTANLSVQLLAPRFGATVPTGQPLTITVLARDLGGAGLTGAGYVVRRFSPGLPTLDSVVVTFPARRDTIRDFTFVVPQALPTSTQLDVYGIARAADGSTRLSDASSVVVVQCTGPSCN